MKAWMGGRKRKLGVEKKSQVQQQRQFFAQRREELERKEQRDAGAAKCQQGARFEDTRPERRPRKRGLILPTLGRDLVALKPVAKAASGVIQMHSVAAPIHDFKDVNSANVTGISMATGKSLRQLETANNQPLALVSPLVSSLEHSARQGKSALNECLVESEKHLAFQDLSASALRDATNSLANAKEEGEKEETERAGDSENRFEIHSDYSNQKWKRAQFAEPPRAQSPVQEEVDSPKRASNFHEEKFNEQRQSLACAASRTPKTTGRKPLQPEETAKIDESRSPTSSPSRVPEIGSSLLEDTNRLPTASSLTEPKVRIRPLQIDPDGFNASVDLFEASLFKLTDSEVRAFSRRPVFAQTPSPVEATKHMGPVARHSRSKAATETFMNDKDEVDVHDTDSSRGQAEPYSKEEPAENATVDGGIALPRADALCQKRTPSPPLFSFRPASNPFTAARETTPSESKNPERSFSIDRCCSFEIKPSRDTLPSFKDLIDYSSSDGHTASGREPSNPVCKTNS